MKKKLLLLLLLLVFCCCASSALAQELRVSQGGQADFSSLTEAVSSAQAGDSIVLEQGTYSAPAETFPIVIDKPLSIRGEGEAVLDSPRFATLLRIVSDDVSVSGVSFLVRKWGIVAAQSRRMTIDGCSFTLADEASRTSSTAMWMEAMKDCTIVNCTFTGVGICVAGDPLSDSSKGKAVLTGLCEVGEDEDYFISHLIENCVINGKPLYYIKGGKDVVVPSDAGGLIAAYCDGITVSGADVSDSSMGLEIVHSKNVVLDNVTADRCGIFGTYVAFAEGGTLRNITVRGTNHGIDTRASSSIIVENCLADGCDQGIFFSLCTDSIMRNCEVRSCGFGCFTAVGSGLVISDCSFDGNADGIYLQNENDTTITDCSIKSSNAVGLRVLKSTAVCESTRFLGNWTGIIIYDSNSAVIRGCELDGNKSAGVYAGNTRNMTVSECAFSGETTAHFEFEGTFVNASVQDCTLSGGMTEMIRLKSEDMPDFQNNAWEQ